MILSRRMNNHFSILYPPFSSFHSTKPRSAVMDTRYGTPSMDSVLGAVNKIG